MTATARPAISAGAWCRPITGFRGLAALTVVAGHTFMAARIYPFTGVIHLIGIIVPTFFVISAFALYRPFALAHLRAEEAPAATAFWWRRFLRIYPLYFTALTAYLLLLPGVRPPGGSVVDYLKLYAFLQIYDENLLTFSGIPAAWFLCDEVAFYLALPGIALAARWLARRLGGRGRLGPRRILQAHTLVAVAMIVIGITSRTALVIAEYPGATALPIANLDFYGIGILLAVASLRERAGLGLPSIVEWARHRMELVPLVLLAGGVAMNLVARQPGTSFSPAEDLWRYGLYTLMVVPLMVVMCLGPQRRGVNAWLGSVRWDRLALLSLHAYLWHQLVLGGFDRYVTEIAEVTFGPRWAMGAALVAGALAVTLTWSVLTRPVLDSPYRRWSGWLPRPADRPAPPLWVRPAGVVAVLAVLGAGAVLAVEYGRSPLEVRGGVYHVAATGASPGDRVVVERDGVEIAAVDADEQGAAVVRNLAPGRHVVSQWRDGRAVVERPIDVLDPAAAPPASAYTDHALGAGLGEITTRDGTPLAAHVVLPGPVEDGPYPTLVELTAYQAGDAAVAQPATAIAQVLGYATVAVNVRGTGCSAGAYEFFGATHAADGYDVVETVAAQDWVEGGTVGLVGFSYGGLAALEAASTAPPSLNSVTALSVYGSAREAFHPGGIANVGFPVGWMDDLTTDAAPSGAAWIEDRIADGDGACARNQGLHGQQVDPAAAYLGDVPADGRHDLLSPATWARTVTVPTFLAAQFHDATIGNDLPIHLDAFERAPVVRTVLTNGPHGDGVSLQVLRRLDQFLALYAAGEVPTDLDIGRVLEAAQPETDVDLSSDVAAPGPDLQVDLTDALDVDDARRRYEATPPVEVLLESGAGGPPGVAAARRSVAFETWPPPASASVRYLAPDGVLTDEAPATGPAARFRTSPDRAGEAYEIEGSDLATNIISDWEPPTPGTSAAWVSPPLDDDQLMIGTGSVDLWVRAGRGTPDVQVVLSTVTDDDETLVQVGWLRTGHRTLLAGSTRLLPRTDYADHQELESGEWTPVRVRLGPFAQQVRAGTRLRLSVGTPGDGQVQWSFAMPPDGATDVDVGQAGDQASRVVLPVVVDGVVEGDEPACGTLRGQPCRPHRPTPNEQVDP